MRLVLAGVGLVIMIVGGVVAWRGKEQNKVEIVSNQLSVSSDQIMVDVGGAVEQPGVYRLAADARVNDALVAAGGLSGEADRAWVARYVNLAELVIDGAKIYIPEIGSTGSGGSTGININTASASELDSLWGVGAKRAADIMANRPYAKTEELVTKAGISQNVYERIKDRIIVY